MLEKFKDLIKKGKKETKELHHIGIILKGISEYSKKEKIPISEGYNKGFEILIDTLKHLIDLKIPISTFYVLPEETKKDLNIFLEVIDPIEKFFNELTKNEIVHTNKIKISILGKWYDMPGRIVEVIKKCVDTTRDYDNFFLNLCINYNGQEEIVDACKLLAMQIRVGKSDPESINKEMIKESIYASAFLPPDLIIITGNIKSLAGFMLWDSVSAKLFLSEKNWPEFSKSELNDAIKEYSKE